MVSNRNSEVGFQVNILQNLEGAKGWSAELPEMSVCLPRRPLLLSLLPSLPPFLSHVFAAAGSIMLMQSEQSLCWL